MTNARRKRLLAEFQQNRQAIYAKEADRWRDLLKVKFFIWFVYDAAWIKDHVQSMQIMAEVSGYLARYLMDLEDD